MFCCCPGRLAGARAIGFSHVRLCLRRPVCQVNLLGALQRWAALNSSQSVDLSSAESLLGSLAAVGAVAVECVTTPVSLQAALVAAVSGVVSSLVSLQSAVHANMSAMTTVSSDPCV